MNIWDDPDTKEWADSVLKEMYPKLRDSNLAITLLTKNVGQGDVKIWVETGAAIFMDKPIIVLVESGALVPERLVRVADEIVEFDGDLSEAVKQRIMDAMKRVTGNG